MAKDLRSYISLLQESAPEELIECHREVDPRFEITGVLVQLERLGKFPAVLFKRPKGSSMPLLANLHANFRRIALALDTEESRLYEDYRRREERFIPPKMVSDGPVKEVILKGDHVDVTKIPIVTYHEKDANAYITLGVMLTKDPELGHRNLGVFRLMLKGKNKFGVQFSESAQTHAIFKKSEALGKPTQVAVIIGHHPAFFVGSVAHTIPGTDKYEVVGGMMGEPLELVKCETVDLEVPARAEIVLECEIPPYVREPEAPFGEFPGTYGPERNNPVVIVKAILMRKDPIYVNSFVGHADNLVLGCMSRLNSIYRTAKLAAPTVADIYMPLSGRHRFTCYISLKNPVEGEAKNAIFGALAADPFLKFVVAVDHDVNIRNDSDVLHAIATRCRADRDVFIISDAKGNPLDPTAREPSLISKTGIDATRHRGYPEEIRVPGAEKINLSDYFGEEALQMVLGRMPEFRPPYAAR